MHELSVSRYIAADPARVWTIMTARIGEWFCPAPWRAEVVVQDRRPGGRSEMMFYGPNGEEMPQRGIYLAWDEGRRFASTDAVVGDLEPAEAGMIGIWQVEPEGEGSRFTAAARHWSEEAMQRHRDMGFEAGWGAAADQLKALCEAEG